MRLSVTQIGEQLELERENLTRLMEALVAERNALSERHAQALELATRQKQIAIEHHQAQEDACRRWLASATDGRVGSLSQAVKELDDDRYTQLAGDLVALAERCREVNRYNGTLILRQQDRTRAALEVLRGAEQSTDVYSLDGELRQTDSSTRSLGKA